MSSQIVKESGKPSPLRGRLDHTIMKRTRECCGIVFTTSIELAQHRYQNHFEFPELRCDRCPDRVFRGQGALTRHIRSHDGFDQRFFAKVHMTSSCWHWTGPLDTKKYAVVKIHHVQYQAHRVAYERIVGPIPDGLTLDHLCGRKNCVRPEHLEPVPHEINMLRWAQRTGFNGIAGTQEKEPILHLVPSLTTSVSNTAAQDGVQE